MNQAQYQFTIDDVIAVGTRAGAKGTPLQKASAASSRLTGRVAIAMVVLLIAAPAAMVPVLCPKSGVEGFIPLLVIVSIVILVAGVVVIGRTSKNSRKRLYQKLDEAGALGKLPQGLEVTLFETGVRFQSESSTTLIRWPTLMQIEEDAAYIYIWHTGLMVYGVPKRAFATPADAAAFLGEARRLWRNSTLPTSTSESGVG